MYERVWKDRANYSEPRRIGIAIWFTPAIADNKIKVEGTFQRALTSSRIWTRGTFGKASGAGLIIDLSVIYR